MDLRVAALADYAAVDGQGKINIVGLFNETYAAAFPVHIPNMHVVLSFTANALEAGTTKEIKIVLQDQDGQTIIAMDGQIGVPQPTRAGRPSILNLCFGIHNLTLAAEGEYQVLVLINGETKTVLNFAALLAPTPPIPAQ